ncbi:hypothetical protein JCM8208_002263 [Rhodotorula glutinis]
MASGSISFPPKRGTSSGATRGGSHRPAPQRTNSAGSRSAPYSRPPPPPAADGKWQHDLFGEKSDLYRPSLNTAALLARAGVVDQSSSSASLRPFGTATPAAQPILHAPASGPQPGAVNTHAMGIKGQNAARQQHQAEIAARRERAEAARQRKVLEDQRQKTVLIAQHEQQGFVVQVEGLVSGTSAEDVQAAFGAYGEIVYCFVPDPNAADLVARLTFSRHADAADACSKLDGAIADGRPLRVKQVDRTPYPPALPPLAPPKLQPSTLAPSSSSFPAPAASSGPFAGVPTGPRAQQQQRRQPAPPPPPPQAQVATPTVQPSKMYADQVEEAQQEALGGGGGGGAVGESMDVDMAPAAPAAVGRGAGGRGGGRGGRAGGGHAAQQQQQQQQQQAALSLAARLSGAGQHKGQQRQQQGKGAKQQQPAPAGLAARLGAPAAAQGQGQAQGKAGRGGGSLLSRLA